MAKKESSSEIAERLLIDHILDGSFPINQDLPGERVLSKDWGIARPALREAMQRLSRDGWLEIQQGKPTRVRDYLKDGNLNILAGLLKTNTDLIPNLVPDLLEMWSLFAPQYTGASIRRAPGLILDLLENTHNLADDPDVYAQSMWKLHHALITYCGNLIYGLIFNTFIDFYNQAATFYYQFPESRESAQQLWQGLTEAAEKVDGDSGADYMRQFLSSTISFWNSGIFEQYQKQIAENEERTDDEVLQNGNNDGK